MVDRRLGRGLDFFLSGGRGQPPATPPSTRENPAAAGPQPGAGQPAAVAKPPSDEVLHVEVGGLVVSPYQPRRTFGEGELQELADSIRSSGILQPILARRLGDRLEIVAG